MTDPKTGGAYLEHDPHKPWHRRLVVLNTNRKPTTRQWLNEDQMRVLRDGLTRELELIAESHAEATRLADTILGRDA
jgi:hypothetical protein